MPGVEWTALCRRAFRTGGKGRWWCFPRRPPKRSRFSRGTDLRKHESLGAVDGSLAVFGRYLEPTAKDPFCFFGHLGNPQTDSPRIRNAINRLSLCIAVACPLRDSIRFGS